MAERQREVDPDNCIRAVMTLVEEVQIINPVTKNKFTYWQYGPSIERVLEGCKRQKEGMISASADKWRVFLIDCSSETPNSRVLVADDFKVRLQRAYMDGENISWIDLIQEDPVAMEQKELSYAR